MKRPESRSEYLVAIIVICVITSAVILIIDYQIKGAILDMTQQYYRARSNEVRGQGSADIRDDINGSANGHLPSDLVYSRDATMEKGSDNRKPAQAAHREDRSDSSGNS